MPAESRFPRAKLRRDSHVLSWSSGRSLAGPRLQCQSAATCCRQARLTLVASRFSPRTWFQIWQKRCS